MGQVVGDPWGPQMLVAVHQGVAWLVALLVVVVLQGRCCAELRVWVGLMLCAPRFNVHGDQDVAESNSESTAKQHHRRAPASEDMGVHDDGGVLQHIATVPTYTHTRTFGEFSCPGCTWQGGPSLLKVWMCGGKEEDR